MNKNISNIFRFIFLLLIQVTVLNKINFGGFINPQIYILYVILFPYHNNHKGYLMMSSFFLGLSIDFFMNSGGINAFSLTLIAYSRQFLFDTIMGKQDKKAVISFKELPKLKSITYILLISFIHITSLYWLENFSFNELGTMFIRVFISTIYSSILIFISLSLFLTKNKK